MLPKIKEFVDLHDSGPKFRNGIAYVSTVGEQCHYIVASDEKSGKNASQLSGLLNYLPEAYKDIDSLSNIVIEQQKQILQMEKQIKYLSSVIETVALGRIQIDVSKELHKYITELANNSNMYSQDGGEIALEVNSSIYSESNKDSEKTENGDTFNNSVKKVSASVGGILEKIADLKVSGSLSDSVKEIKNSSENLSSHGKESLSMSGKAIYKYGEIKCDPSLKLIEKMVASKDKRLTKDFIVELKRNPHKENERL
jgi:uncharacterized coiled-coil protein SlyX